MIAPDKSKTTPGIVDYVARYAVLHDIAARTLQQLQITSKMFDQWAGGVTVGELSDDLVNGWLLHRKQTGRRPATVRANRTSLLMLWRAAHEEGLAPVGPRRVRLIKCPERIVEGYDAGQMGALLTAADQLPSRFRGSQMPRRIWWRSLLLTHWDTALRLGDLLSVECGWINRQPDGFGLLSVIQQKSGRAVRHHLRPETVAAIDECLSLCRERKLIWAGVMGRRRFYRAFKVLAKSAGLSGTSKYIRRGSASEVEKVSPGCGKLHLGHSPKSTGLFEQNYAVWRICGRTAPLPPAIVPVQPKGGA